MPGILFLAILLSQCSVKPEYPTTGSVNRLSPEIDGIIAPGTLPEILADGFDWSEGPLWLPDIKVVIFSDDSRGGETGSNGLLLDSEGMLVLCQHGDRRMARIMPFSAKPEISFLLTPPTKWSFALMIPTGRWTLPESSGSGREAKLRF